MPETRSINQNNPPPLLPNFRNLGTVLRIVLLANVIALFALAAQASSMAVLKSSLLHGAALLQPVLLASMLMLYALEPRLRELGYRDGAVAVVGIAALVTLMIDLLGGELFSVPGEMGGYRFARHLLGSVGITVLLLIYFNLRAQILSPAKQEARLQALQARIRPHFLFNTINAVLSIVRADPKRAETALEDMADLFRMAMTEPHELVALSKEVALARQYLAIEELRLGERLQVQWDTKEMPQDALIPPLVLQPLLENAVYHGIEPLPEGGCIAVKLYRHDDELHLEVGNPAQERTSPRNTGHKMALSNIRERLALLFDVEAQYLVKSDANHYQVHVIIPYLKEQSA